MKFDIIITTYNRPEWVERLVDQIIKCRNLPQSIIIIDSSTHYDCKIKDKNDRIKYIYSRHKNQPYQRYLGYLKSSSNILIYLDDDMEILDLNAFDIIITQFENNDIVALGLNFENNNLFLNRSLPRSFTSSRKSFFFELLRIITANPDLKAGKYWWCGIKGKQPINGGITEWFSGGAFAVKKENLYVNFNFTLFNLYEDAIGKGEDGILAFTISKLGTIYFLSEKLFLHNDTENSVYSQNFYSFAKRVSCSRLYLSLEYARLNKYPKIMGYIVYNWFMFFRVVGILINVVIRPTESRRQVLTGSLTGWKLAVFGIKKFKISEPNIYWDKEASKDFEYNN